MRSRWLSLILLMLGTAALAAALATQLLLVPTTVRLPLEPDTDLTTESSDYSYLSFATGQVVEDIDAVTRSRARGDLSDPAVSEDVAVWAGGTVTTEADDDFLGAGEITVCLDRRTAEALPECAANEINGEKVPIRGLVLIFPFGTEQRDYDLWDSPTEQTHPARFDGEEEVDGLGVYRFEVEIPETQIRTADVPGAWVGSPEQASVEAAVLYAARRTLYVEPTSGLIIGSEDFSELRLQGPTGETVTLTSGTFRPTEETQANGVAAGTELRDTIRSVSVVLPWTLAAIGVVLLVAGGLLLRRSVRRQTRTSPPEDLPGSAFSAPTAAVEPRTPLVTSRSGSAAGPPA